MNNNAWIFFIGLLSLLLCFIFGRSAFHRDSIVQQKIFACISLLLLLCSLIGGASLTWRMIHGSSSVSEPTPLPASSQVIIQTSVTRSSLSGKDGTLNWNYPYRSLCAMNEIFAVANGIIYERGALPQKQEVCIQAVRLNNATFYIVC
jgi:magnesium-transporting ATPase (P-type)